MLRSFGATHRLDYVALRYFNVYGPRMDADGSPYAKVLMEWMERIAAGLPPVIHGDGLQTADLVYVDDVAAANVLAACVEEPSSRVLNVASGRETSLLSLAHTLLRCMGSDLGVQHSPAGVAKGAVRQLADVSRALETVGFRARIPLQEGLRRLVEWWRAEAATGPAPAPSLLGASRWR
jgi:UDP-glucose 4-epimerase